MLQYSLRPSCGMYCVHSIYNRVTNNRYIGCWECLMFIISLWMAEGYTESHTFGSPLSSVSFFSFFFFHSVSWQSSFWCAYISSLLSVSFSSFSLGHSCPKVCRTLGVWLFQYIGTVIWNSLPFAVRPSLLSCQNPVFLFRMLICRLIASICHKTHH